MSWDGSDRRSRLPDDWEELRAERLRIDGYRCTWRLPSGKRCPRRATDVDHKIAMSDDHRVSALQSLCAHHHARKSSAEGHAAKAAKKASRLREPEQHPGRVG